jgi:urea transport system permease protein
MRTFLLALALLMPLATVAQAQTAARSLAEVLAENRETLERPQRASVGPLLEAIVATGDPNAPALLEAWADRRLYLRKDDGTAFIGQGSGTLQLTDAATGQDAGSAPAAEFDQLRPGGGVRAAIASALVQFQLSDPDRSRRDAALTAIVRSPERDHLEALRDTLDDPDPMLAARKARMERILTIQFDRDPAARIGAIEGFGADTGLDLRGALNPLVATRRVVTDGAPPAGNVAARLDVGADLSANDAFAMLVQAGNAPPPLDPADQRRLLSEHIENGAVAGIPLHQLNSRVARDRAYDLLEAQGLVPAAATEAEVAAVLDAHAFWEVYAEPNNEVTAAANEALESIGFRVKLMQFADLALDALSLGSIFFLAAIGLAITFGVMRVINMAHGDFIMLGAYTGYVTQTVIADTRSASPSPCRWPSP